MNELKIIDNSLEKDIFSTIQNTMMFGGDFPWFFHNRTSGIKDVESLRNFQFNHVFYCNDMINSQYFELVKPTIKMLNSACLIRVKANLTTYADNNYVGTFHTDHSELDKQNYKTAILYLNSTDGGTKFQDDSIVECKENRLVIFNGNLSHAAITHTDCKIRVVINFVYIEKDL